MAQLSGQTERTMLGDLAFAGGGMSGRHLGFEAWDHDADPPYQIDTVLKHNDQLWWASAAPAADDEPGVTSGSVWMALTAAPSPTPTPTPTYTYYLGLRADTAFVATDFTISDTDEGLAISGIPDGERRHVAYARLQSLGAFTYVYLYAAGFPNTHNQIGSWLAAPAPVILNGEPHNVIYSRAAFDHTANSFVVEAG